MSDKDFINSILVDENVDDDTASFLLKYISSWINDKGIDINTDTIKKMNENKDLIDKLKILYSKEKIIDTINNHIIGSLNSLKNILNIFYWGYSNIILIISTLTCYWLLSHWLLNHRLLNS